MANRNRERVPALPLALVAVAFMSVVSVLSIAAQQPAKIDAVTQMLNEGSAAMQRGDLPKAEAVFRRVTAYAPTRADGYFGLGLVQLREGAIAPASVALEKALQLNARLGEAHLFLGIAQYQAGQPEAALASLRAELAQSPDNLEALTWTGIVALGSDHPEQAVAPLDHAAALKPDDAQVLFYCARAHALVTEATLTKLAKLDPDSEWVHRARGEDFGRSGEHEKAIAEYLVALKKQPGDADVLEELGEEQEDVGRFEEATRAFGQALALNPHSASAKYNLGKMEVQTGKAEAGVALLREAQAGHAVEAPTDLYLGTGLAKLGQNAEAARWLELAIASAPSSSTEESAYYQLARVYMKLNRKVEAERALDHLKVMKAESMRGAREGPDAALSKPAAAGGVTTGQP